MSAASFLLPPQPLTRRQRLVFWAAALLVAGTRFWALSRTMWEWDEALFALAVREYDVVDHRPHPPGFPLFIAAAKVIHLAIDSEFRALQVVTLLGAILLFPATFALARELRFTFTTSLLGAIFYAFAPNVWYYGGTAFSDIPATTAVIAANALLLRGCREGRAYVIGALLLGVSLAVRPQLLLCAVASLTLSTFFQWRRSRRLVVVAMSIVIMVVAISYVWAAVASRPAGRGYLDVVAAQSHYVRTVDSFLNPGRPWLELLIRSFFIRAIRAPREVVLFHGLFGLIALGASIRRRAVNVWLLILIFAPLNVLSWLMLDIAAAPRYAVAYAALYALLAAEGARILSTLLRSPRAQTIAQAALMLGLTAQVIYWAAPSIRVVRTTDSPPVAAMQWVVNNLSPAKTRLHVFEGLGPVSDHYLREYDITIFQPGKRLPAVTFDRSHYYMIDERSPYPGAQNFAYPLGALWDIARARYFAISVLPLDTLAHFGDGWFEPETEGTGAWRWMGPRGVVTLAPMKAPAALTLQYRVPAQTASKGPTVTITFNGEVVARHSVKEGMNDTEVIVMPKSDRSNETVVEIDRTIVAVETGDLRELGLQLFSWSWSPVPPSASAR